MQLAFRAWNKTPQPDNATKLLFLHGLGGVGYLWRSIAASLETRFSIFAPDQRGHGGSINPTASQDEYNPRNSGNDLKETLTTQNFNPCWVIGHSMGVRSAVALAHLQPEMTQGLILIDLGFSGLAGGGLGENLSQFLKALPDQFESREEAKDFLMSQAPDPAIAQYLLAVLTIGNPIGSKDPLKFSFDKNALLHTIDAARGFSVRGWLEEAIQRGIPILVLRGETSLVWDKDDFEKEKAKYASSKNIQFVEVQGAGHGLPFEKRKEFVEILEDFVTGT